MKRQKLLNKIIDDLDKYLERRAKDKLGWIQQLYLSYLKKKLSKNSIKLGLIPKGEMIY